jgi:hypothetical protein
MRTHVCTHEMCTHSAHQRMYLCAYIHICACACAYAYAPASAVDTQMHAWLPLFVRRCLCLRLCVSTCVCARVRVRLCLVLCPCDDIFSTVFFLSTYIWMHMFTTCASTLRDARISNMHLHMILRIVYVDKFIYIYRYTYVCMCICIYLYMFMCIFVCIVMWMYMPSHQLHAQSRSIFI